ncbi:MAG: hypothetical protein AMXMBFR36_35570 [Acidobacteriota bacterium]
MNPTLALFTFELSRRRPLPVIGLALGLLAAALPAVAPLGPPDLVRGVASLLFAAVLLGVGGFFVGTGLFVEDLVSGRASFFFSTPLRTSTLLIVRLLAAFTTVSVSALLALAPSMLLGASTVEADGLFSVAVRNLLAVPPLMLEVRDPTTLLVGCLVAVALGCFAAGNAVALAGRVRSAWLLLDVASAFVLILSLLRSREWLDIPTSAVFRSIVVPAFVAMLGLILVGATAAQAIRGRADSARSRSSFSVAFCAASLLGSAGLVQASREYATPQLAEFPLESIQVREVDARWLEVRGSRFRPEPLFATYLVDRETGIDVRLDLEAAAAIQTRTRKVQLVTPTGPAYWVDREGRRSRSRLMRFDLQRPAEPPEATGLEFEAGLLDWQVSPDGFHVGRIHRLAGSRIEIAIERTDGSGTALVRQVNLGTVLATQVLDVATTSLRIVAVVEPPESSAWTPPASGSTDDAVRVLRCEAGEVSVAEPSPAPSAPLPWLVEVRSDGSSPEPVVRRLAALSIGNHLPQFHSSGSDSSLLMTDGTSALQFDRATLEPAGCTPLVRPEWAGYGLDLVLPLAGGRYAVIERAEDSVLVSILDAAGERLVSSPLESGDAEVARVASTLSTRDGVVEFLLPDPVGDTGAGVGYEVHRLDPLSGGAEKSRPLDADAARRRLLGAETPDGPRDRPSEKV